MKKILFILLILSSMLSYAENQVNKNDIQKIDTKKFCIYENKIYSKGSIIKMNNIEYVCDNNLDEATTSVNKYKNNHLQWMKVDAF